MMEHAEEHPPEFRKMLDLVSTTVLLTLLMGAAVVNHYRIDATQERAAALKEVVQLLEQRGVENDRLWAELDARTRDRWSGADQKQYDRDLRDWVLEQVKASREAR